MTLVPTNKGKRLQGRTYYFRIALGLKLAMESLQVEAENR